tara:strand:- start:1234 stop:1854 length:621 start_codon:yes stop_codon:yes gene_type:complete
MLAAAVAAMHYAWKALLIFFLVMIGKSIQPIINFFSLIFDGIIFLGKLFTWFAHLISWFATDFININMLFNDLIGGIVRITRIVVIGLTDIFFGMLRYIVNTLFTPIFGNIWGWDQSDLNKNSEINRKSGKKGNKKCNNKEGDAKCFSVDDDKVPFTVIIATIFMPPLGVFMRFGLSYWINIIICIGLTMLYYLPGLIYALLLLFN